MSETSTTTGDDAAPDDRAPFNALEHELRLIIRRAQSAGARIARRVHPELEASAYPLLAHIAQNPGTRGSDLAAHFGVGRATVSRQLSRLADLGLVERDTDPEDSRGQRITLTADGAARFEQARANRIEMFAGALSHWDRQDVRLLADLLHRYSEDLVSWQAQHR
ncbi:MarR family winged helix-turn-helix transcriptional regulator [Myceligenerans xiligouense]|uniref:DNA-binding MarR family transcriptional regulator n=1 Tax=Myceligenerans xiligouense TaxID=253184 RepID=A0A3N4YRF0_9MICO|nr:MarR family winged helix-turn-helix transcriptional regulator [Myceligenerans xiligouense]RPF23183.1 DNA-binding MarR family transcriptional regulator [Myceligenerans xiligouense]